MGRRHKRTHTSSQAATFGFRWGQLDVIRNAEYRGNKALTVETDSASVEIYVSPKGQSIRVFRDGKELK